MDRLASASILAPFLPVTRAFVVEGKCDCSKNTCLSVWFHAAGVCRVYQRSYEGAASVGGITNVSRHVSTKWNSPTVDLPSAYKG